MRSVLYIDPPAFCTSVEGIVAPALRTRPVAVAPPGADRATILALSAEARLAGLTQGMPVRRALKLCPDLVLLPPNPHLYARASRALHEVLRIYAPVIEPRGYGHAFLDLTGTGRLFGPAVDVAARVQREVRERLRLPVSVGIAGNKLVSRAATTVVKPEPLLEVPGGAEAGFLAPHPLDVLPDLNPGIRSRLDDYQLELIGEVAAIAESALCAVFGSTGRTLRARARGIDPSPVLPPERRAEFYVAHTLATDTNDLGVLHPLLRVLGERLGMPASPERAGGAPAPGRGHLQRLHRRRPHRIAQRRRARRRAVGRRTPRLHARQHTAPCRAHGGAHAGSAGDEGIAVGTMGCRGRIGAERRKAGRAKRGAESAAACPGPHPHPLRHPRAVASGTARALTR